MERRGRHPTGTCRLVARAGSGRVLLRLQHGSQRHPAIRFTPAIGRCLSRLQQDYERLSATPQEFGAFSEALGLMQRTQPNYSADDLARIRVPVTIVQSEHDEFIKREHAEYLARSIPNAEFMFLPGVSHFAPLQRPEQFDAAIPAFLQRVVD